MNISFNWLKSYIDTPFTISQASTILTETGLEVEAVHKINTNTKQFDGLVVGEIKACWQHPNADRLRLTTVTTNGENTLQIVCGAPNVAVGQKVVVAPIGATLNPTNGDPFTIKKSKIRGELSEGMLCAGDEIGINDSHDGIIVLQKDVKIGTPIAEIFENKDQDYCIEIGLTPNRTDAFCHIGVSRDIAAVLQKPLNKPKVNPIESIVEHSPINVTILNKEACPRYSGVLLENIEVKQSPEWLQNRLKSIGLNPINNIVDVTNFVLHECGHPLHAFDADKIVGDQIIVRFAQNGEKIQSLDNKTITLTEENLVIANQTQPMAIAGVIGGLACSVSNNTNKIFIESAYFNPQTIRKSARLAGYKTDASFRYERGADPNATLYALRRAVQLLQSITQVKVSSPELDVQLTDFEPIKMHLLYAFCDKIIGQKINREQIKQILIALDFEIIYDYAEGIEIKVPSYRTDVTRPIDVVEELLRIYGLNQIKLIGKIQYKQSYPIRNQFNELQNQISEQLIAAGFSEIMCNSFTQTKYIELIPTFKEQKISPLNPLNDELDCLRPNLIFGFLESTAYNINRKNGDLMLFEWGVTYQKINQKNIEKPFLGILITGNTLAENWLQPKGHHPHWVLGNQIQLILHRCGLNKIEQNPSNNLVLSEGIDLKNGNQIFGSFGKVRSSLAKIYGIKQDLFYAELDWEFVLSTTIEKQFHFKELPKHPMVKRDLALLVPKNISFEQIKKVTIDADEELLSHIELFDVYQGENLPEGFKSYAISCYLQSANKTLTDTETDKVIQKLITNFGHALGATIRQ